MGPARGPLFAWFQDAVRLGGHDGFVAIVVADAIGRLPVFTEYRHHLRGVLLHSDKTPSEPQPISDFRAHGPHHLFACGR